MREKRKPIESKSDYMDRMRKGREEKLTNYANLTMHSVPIRCNDCKSRLKVCCPKGTRTIYVQPCPKCTTIVKRQLTFATLREFLEDVEDKEKEEKEV